MDYNKHSDLEGRHALLSPSYYHWVNYNDQKLEARYIASRAAQRGTNLHELAHSAIKLGVKLSKADPTLSKYVNDAIGYKMEVEVPLFYSDNCFGHADTLSFRRSVLRIHDLKTGINPASVHQLEIYAAIFCLEYAIDPFSIEMKLRIYQNGESPEWIGDPDVIANIMDRIVDFDVKIEMMKERGL